MKKIQESEQTCKQIGWITSLRALATVSVVMIHVISGWLGEDTKALDLRVLFDLVGIQLVVRWAVPVFGMISGYLLLNPNKSMPIEKIFRYLNKMLLALLFFALPFCIIENVVSNSFNVTMALMVKSLIDWLSGHSWAHMWYVYTMAGMYIVLPLLRSFTKSATKKEVEVVLLGLFIFTSVIPTVNSVLHQEFINLIPVNSCIFFYFLMGYYLPKNKIPKGKRWLIVSIVTTMLMLVLRMLGISFSYGINNIFIVLYSILIFNVAVESAFLEKISKNIFVKEIARYSFGIYILHPFFLNVLNKGLHIYPDILPAIAGEALFFIIALGGGYLLSKCLCVFAIFRRILL